MSNKDNNDDENSSTFKLQLAFFGPKGNSFGQVLELTVKVTENQEMLFKAAITMTEAGIADFEQCVEALKMFKGDENAACQYLLEQNAATATPDNKL